MNESVTKNTFWQCIRGGAILAVIYIHCQAGVDMPLKSLNGITYFVFRNITNFPVAVFFFLSGYFMKPVDNVKAFYLKRLPRLVLPYLFYTIGYLVLNLLLHGNIGVKKIVFAFLFGTAATPLYYIVVLVYYTLLSPFLLKAVYSRKTCIIILASTPFFLLIGYAIRFTGIDVWDYLKYSPVWLSFYFMGMVINTRRPIFNLSVLWLLLPIAFISELISTFVLLSAGGIAYSQMRFSGAFYSVIIILLAYQYSSRKSIKVKWLACLGDDSYAIYYMHCIFIALFHKIIPFESNAILLVYQIGQLAFATLMSLLAIILIKKLIKKASVRAIMGV